MSLSYIEPTTLEVLDRWVIEAHFRPLLSDLTAVAAAEVEGAVAVYCCLQCSPPQIELNPS